MRYKELLEVKFTQYEHVKVYENPTGNNILILLQNLRILRYLFNKGALYVWDASDATHGDISKELGIEKLWANCAILKPKNFNTGMFYLAKDNKTMYWASYEEDDSWSADYLFKRIDIELEYLTMDDLQYKLETSDDPIARDVF